MDIMNRTFRPKEQIALLILIYVHRFFCITKETEIRISNEL